MIKIQSAERTRGRRPNRWLQFWFSAVRKRYFVQFLRGIVIPFLAYLTGCETVSYSFRLVDATTHQPLLGVETDVFTQGHVWGLRFLGRTEGLHLPGTGPDGIVTVGGLGPEPDFSHNFRFSLDGYAKIDLIDVSVSGPRRWSIVSYPPNGTVGQVLHEDFADAVHNERLDILMYPYVEANERLKRPSQ